MPEKKSKILKLLLFLTIVGFTLLAFVFLLKEKADTKSTGLLVYIPFIGLILASFGLFILSLKEKSSIEELTVNEDIVEVDEKEEELKEEKVEEEIDENDIVKLAAKLVPSEGEKELKVYTEKFLSNVCKELNLVQGLFFIKNLNADSFSFVSDYAYFSEEMPKDFITGETLSGQVAKNKSTICITDIPADYIKVVSGLGESSPNFLIISPVLLKGKVLGIIELASFTALSQAQISAVEKASENVAVAIEKLQKSTAS